MGIICDLGFSWNEDQGETDKTKTDKNVRIQNVRAGKHWNQLLP